MERISDSEIFNKYLEDLELQGSTKKTIENYGSAVKVYVDWLHDKKLTILSVCDMDNKDIVEDFLKYLRKERKKANGNNISFARIKVIFSALNNLYEYLEYNKYVKKNIILIVRKRYLKQYKKGYEPAVRKAIDVEEMSRYLNSIPNPRDKAINLLSVKTGIRRENLRRINCDDIDWDKMKITIKSRLSKKRTFPYVFFDDECKRVLKYWGKRREMIALPDEKAFFVGDYGRRISKNSSYDAVVKWSTRYGLHNSKSDRLEDHFSHHNLRHCFTTYLRRNGMKREYRKELRGDKRTDVMDLYDHIDEKELRREYLAAIPKFDVY